MKAIKTLFAYLRPADAVVCLAVLILAVSLFILPAFRGTGEGLAITANGETTHYSLADNRELMISSNGHTLTVCIAEGQAWVESSTCPEGICRRTGRISRTGESILCSRADVLLTVLGEGGFDAVTG